MPKIEQSGEKRKSRRLLGLAILFAFLAGLGTLVHLKLLERRLEHRLAPQEEQTIQVVVAAQHLQVGSPVNTSTMAVRTVPQEYVNSDVITADMFDSVDGAIINQPLERGKMLSSDYFDLNIPEDFSGTIRMGYRAVTVQVGEINSISGLIRPGNFVDIATRIHAGNISGETDSGEVIMPVLEDVLVLATDQKSARPNEDEFKNLQVSQRRQSYDTLTLEVTPEQAALLTLAEAHGSIVATLRNPDDTAGLRYNRIGLSDLVGNADALLRQAQTKHANQSVAGVHTDTDGNLVTQGGVKITDPNVRMNEDGLLVTKDGTVLSGRGLVVGKDGKIYTKDGKLVDTASLVAGKDGTLVDKNGTVVDGNGYSTTKGGFLVDKDGNVYTHDGKKLSGVEVGKDGRVRTQDGKVLNADDISVASDGTVRLNPDKAAPIKLDTDGNPVSADGTPVPARDLVDVDKDGVVRTKDGKVLKGVHVGQDGKLYDADGNEVSAKDVINASGGMHLDAHGNLVDQDGNPVQTRSSADKAVHVDKNGHLVTADGQAVQAQDLVSVDKDGVVRTKDGKVLKGVHVGKDGKLYDAAGNKLSTEDIALAAKGLHRDQNGNIVDENGKTVTARDLVEVDPDGTVRTKDGKVIAGAYVDKDGVVRNADGSILSATDVAMQNAASLAAQQQGSVLAGVAGEYDPTFAKSISNTAPTSEAATASMDVEYIISGGGDGVARTFMIHVRSLNAKDKE
jgi:pilus assembly protein CpaB